MQVNQVLDVIQVTFWTFTYLLIIYNSLRYASEKKVMMPYVAGTLNLAWEFNAVFYPGMLIGRVIWLILDFIIFGFNCYFCGKRRYLYIIISLFAVVCFHFMFNISDDAMGLISFAIDCIMAVNYLVSAKTISGHSKLTIAICKLLGDLAAWIAYFDTLIFIKIIGAFILLVNLFYVSYCLEEKNRHTDKRGGNKHQRTVR